MNEIREKDATACNMHETTSLTLSEEEKEDNMKTTMKLYKI